MKDEKFVSIEKYGVISIETGYNSSIMVNSDYIIDELSELIDKSNPKVDTSGNFAGRIKIEIEFLGDMEDS